MTPHPQASGWVGRQEIDERWFQEWVAYGLCELGRMLANQARFQQWCEETGR